MKANESVANFKPTLRMYTNFAVRTVKKVCAEIGPRPCGSEAELKAQNFMAAQVGDSADEVKQDTFKVAPGAFFGWRLVTGTLLLLSLASAIADIFLTSVTFAPYVIFVSTVLMLIALGGEFLFYKKTLDPFYKKTESHNTYCIRKPKGEVKKRIILCGHSDSSFEWTPTHLGGAKLLYFWFIYPVVGWVILILAGILMLAKPETFNWVVWVDCAFLPGYIMLFKFINTKLCVEGANDNLTGCMVAGAVLKYMGDNDIRFENTEVIAMFSGGEEEGLRGAKAACIQHPEFKDKNVETCVVALDTIKDYDDMAIYTRDMSGLTKHDSRVAALVKKAGETCGLDLKYALLFCGASDAAAITQAGIPAVCFAAMNPGPPKYYHTRDDKADIMEVKTMEKGIELALETVYLFDEQGLKENY